MGVTGILKVCLQSARQVDLRDYVNNDSAGNSPHGVSGSGIRNVDPTIQDERYKNRALMSEVATLWEKKNDGCDDSATPAAAAAAASTANSTDNDSTQQHQQQEQPAMTPGSIHRTLHSGARKLLIGIDISVMICNASYAFGEKLGDERHFSNYGRATLLSEGSTTAAGTASASSGPTTASAAGPPATATTTTTTTPTSSPTAKAEEILSQSKGNWCPTPSQVSEAISTFEPTVQSYINECVGYVMKRLKVFVQDSSGAKVLVVMDGLTPPIKQKESSKRRSQRQEHERRRNEPVFDHQNQQGNKDDDEDEIMDDEDGEDDNDQDTRRRRRRERIEAAIEEHNIRRAKANKRAGAGIYHPYIILALREALRHDRIPFMIAPYEADGQLATWANLGLLDLVVTEDSDLIAYGTPSVLYKTHETLKHGIPAGKLFQFKDLGGVAVGGTRDSGVDGGGGAPASSKGGGGTNVPPEYLMDFTPIMMAVVYVLLGCDYYDKKLQGIGIKTAIEIVRLAFLGEKTGTPTTKTRKHTKKNPNRRRNDVGTDRSSSKPAYSPLDRVWELAYERSYLDEQVLTDDFKSGYERGFCEALFMYRHPIYYHPLLGETMWANTKTKTDVFGNSQEYKWDNLQFGDPILRRCEAYDSLCHRKSRARVEGITGGRFKKSVSSDCAQGIWDWKKITERQQKLIASRGIITQAASPAAATTSTPATSNSREGAVRRPVSTATTARAPPLATQKKSAQINVPSASHVKPSEQETICESELRCTEEASSESEEKKDSEPMVEGEESSQIGQKATDSALRPEEDSSENERKAVVDSEVRPAQDSTESKEKEKDSELNATQKTSESVEKDKDSEMNTTKNTFESKEMDEDSEMNTIEDTSQTMDKDKDDSEMNMTEDSSERKEKDKDSELNVTQDPSERKEKNDSLLGSENSSRSAKRSSESIVVATEANKDGDTCMSSSPSSSSRPKRRRRKKTTLLSSKNHFALSEDGHENDVHFLDNPDSQPVPDSGVEKGPRAEGSARGEKYADTAGDDDGQWRCEDDLAEQKLNEQIRKDLEEAEDLAEQELNEKILEDIQEAEEGEAAKFAATI